MGSFSYMAATVECADGNALVQSARASDTEPLTVVDRWGTGERGGIVVARSGQKTRLTNAMVRDLVRCVDRWEATLASSKLRTGRYLAERGYVIEQDHYGFAWRPTDKGIEMIAFLRSLDMVEAIP